MLGEDGAFRALTVIGALAGLVPWALVAGGVRLPPWLFARAERAAAASIVAVDNNPGGMFPLMLLVVWLTLDVALGARRRPSPRLAVRSSPSSTARIDKGSLDESGIVYFTGGLGISWLSGCCCAARRR